MKIYFGRVDLDEKELEDLFENNGKHYYFELENDDDGNFAISDTCGRRVPFDRDNIDSLINVLSYMRDYSRTKNLTSKYLNKALGSLASMYSLEASRE
jgi:hypothetical protein